MTQRIVLFNGPPFCGKDAAAMACLNLKSWMTTHTPPEVPICVFDRMSMPIKRAFAAMLHVNIDRWGNVEGYETHKDDPQWGQVGLDASYRQWQIDFSERFMKPLYGEAIFGHLFNSRCLKQHKDAVIFVPDCGFDIEHKTLAEHHGEDNILVIKIYRDGCTFANDSRKYLSVGSHFIHPNDNVYNVTNNGSIAEFETKILSIVKEWLS